MGAGGVGKTAIAAEVARSLVETFAQRIAWVSADGREDFSLSGMLDEVATQLRHSDLRKLALEPKKEQVRDLVISAPTLVILDNFETIAPEEGNLCIAWLAQHGLCSALVTTRERIETVLNIPIDPMLPEEANALLQKLIAQAHDPKAFENLDRAHVIQTAESNPLVMQWVVGQIDLAQDAEEVLNDLKHGEGPAAERVFARSFNLPQLKDGGRAVLLSLSLFVPSATRKALAEVAGLDKEKNRKRFREAVKTLSSLWLLRTADAGERLAIEGLTRELTKARLSSDPRSKILPPRYVARFLRYAQAYSQPIAEHLERIETEKDNILNAMDVAYELNDWNSLMRIRDAIDDFLDLRGYWDEAIRKGEQGLNAARQLGAEIWIAQFTHNVAIIYQNRGSLAEARRLSSESLEISRKLGDQRGVASSLHNLGLLAQNQGNLFEARRLYDESLEIARKLGDQRNIAATLCSLGVLAQNQGDLSEARRLYDESLEIARKLGDQRNIAATLLGLGALAQNQGDLSETRRLYDESLEISRKLGDQRGVATSLHQLGTLSFAEEDYQKAEKLLAQSLDILKKLGDRRNVSECLESIGKLKIAQNSLADAHYLYDEALQIAQTLGDKFRIASLKHSLGLLAAKENDMALASELFREALSIFEELGSPKVETVRRDLERVAGKSA
jgi:tetratricopeptide (TPR) repeat protein